MDVSTTLKIENYENSEKRLKSENHMYNFRSDSDICNVKTFYTSKTVLKS